MSEGTPAILGLNEAAVVALLKRAIRNTLLLGLIPGLILLVASGWRNAGMLGVGAAISAASLWEWMRLAQVMSARMRGERQQRGTFVLVLFFLFRLMIFGGVIYGSLKCLQGSPVALLCGLSLAVATLVWEALQLLQA